MRKKYIGKTSPFSLINGKVYDILSVENGWYRIIDETEEDYLYPPIFFVEEDEEGDLDMTVHEWIMEHLKMVEPRG